MLSEILLAGLICVIFNPKPLFFFVVIVIIEHLMVTSSIHHVVFMKLFKGLGVHYTTPTPSAG
jgi:hypothetical protein